MTQQKQKKKARMDKLREDHNGFHSSPIFSLIYPRFFLLLDRAAMSEVPQSKKLTLMCLGLNSLKSCFISIIVWTEF